MHTSIGRLSRDLEEHVVFDISLGVVEGAIDTRGGDVPSYRGHAGSMAALRLQEGEGQWIGWRLEEEGTTSAQGFDGRLGVGLGMGALAGT